MLASRPHKEGSTRSPHQVKAKNGEDIRHRKVPGNQGDANTNRLLDYVHPSVRDSRRANVTTNSFGFASKPPGESERVVYLSPGFSQRFTGFVSQYACEILLILADESVPFQ